MTKWTEQISYLNSNIFFLSSSHLLDGGKQWLLLWVFSQEDFALKSKLWPPSFLQHLPIFAGNSRFTGISQLRAGKTRSKRPRSHCLSTGHLLPYMWASFHPLDPSWYLSSFSSWMKLCAIIIVQCKTLTCFLYQGMWQLQWQDCNVGITKIIVYNLGDGIIGLTKLYCSEMVSCKSMGSRPLPAASATVWGGTDQLLGSTFQTFQAFQALQTFLQTFRSHLLLSVSEQFSFATIVQNSTPAFQNCQFKSNKQQWEKSSDDYLSCF